MAGADAKIMIHVRLQAILRHRRVAFIASPNHNSVPFREFYNISEAETVIRGSPRYEGNPEFINVLIDLRMSKEL